METRELVEKKQARQRRAGEKRRRYRFEEKLKAVRRVEQARGRLSRGWLRRARWFRPGQGE